jgi:putative transcriptional regulator
MNQISTIRAQLGVTQSAMADGLGVTQGNVSNYEHGQKMPPDVAARLIVYAKARNLLLTYDDVYGPVKKPPARTSRKASPATG